VLNSLLGDYFGRTAFGRIAGLTATLSSPLAIVAPVLVGLGVDRFHGYFLPLLILTAISMLAALLFFLAGRPAEPIRS
jgi:cyanate permease